MNKKKLAIYTIVSNNYLHFARTLLKSVKAQHPTDCDVFCVIVDKDLSHAENLSNEFKTIRLDELGIENLNEFTFQYTVLELNTAVKPWGMEYLLKGGYQHVMYIDPDIKLYKPLDEVMQSFDDGADVVLTPHLIAPMTDDLRPTELDIRRAGTYNMGFCAVKNTQNTLSFIDWWEKKLYKQCLVDFEKGIFTDQSWIDLVPSLFDRVFFLKHPGYNIAYWNLAQRKIEYDYHQKEWFSNKQPLKFFHYSGLNPMNPAAFSKHQNRFTLKTLGPAKKLTEEYVKDVLANGASFYSTLEYGFSTFNNGEKIPDQLRKLYLVNEEFRQKFGQDPYEKSEVLLNPTPSIFNVLSQNCMAMYLVWNARDDLKQAFDLTTVEGSNHFRQWFLSEGENYYSKELISKWNGSLKEHSSQQLEADIQNIKVLDKIFYRILGRKSVNGANKKLARLSKYKLTAIICVLIVASTKESRSKPKLLNRISNAIKDIIIGTSEQSHQNINTTNQSSVDLNFFYGLYLDCDDNPSDGVWSESLVVLPIPDNEFSEFEIEIIYPVEIYNQTNAGLQNELSFYVDGQLIEKTPVGQQGTLKIHKKMMRKVDKARKLIIRSNANFVPKEVGLNNDDRSLSYRIKKATINNVLVLDSGAQTFTIKTDQLYKNIGVNLIGYLAAELGIGEAARNMAKSFTKSEIQYHIVDVGYQSSNRQEDKSAWRNATNKQFDIDVLYVNADQTPTTIDYLNQTGHAHADIRIGFWHWEQPKLPEKYISSFDGLDEVWVPSSFVQDAVSKISPVPVFKVPHAVEFEIKDKLNRVAFGIDESSFAVLVMYDFHSYRFRKNPEAAVEAFCIAARKVKSQKMTLVIKTINAEHYAEDYKNLQESVSDINVVFINEVYSSDKIHALQACCDCLLSLHRAEGFGFAPAEMMYLGKPVIATGWSGNMEFMNHMNSFPVNYTLKELETKIGVYEPGLVWAEPDVEHAAFCLEKLVEDTNLYSKIGQNARATIVESYNSATIGNFYKQRLALLKSRK